MKKLLIIGTAYSKNKAPIENRSYDVWSVSSEPSLSRYNAVFDFHDNYKNDPERYTFLKSLKCPVYLKVNDETIPYSINFPIEEITEQYGDYFTNSIALMVVFALWQGYEHIELYGVHMSAQSEYSTQRPCLEYWLGYAEAKGVTVLIDESSELCKSLNGVYGYDTNDKHIKILNGRIKEFKAKIKLLQAQAERIRDEINAYSGALQATEFIKRNMT